MWTRKTKSKKPTMFVNINIVVVFIDGSMVYFVLMIEENRNELLLETACGFCKKKKVFLNIHSKERDYIVIYMYNVTT